MLSKATVPGSRCSDVKFSQPVPEIPTFLSAYVPAPMMGASPYSSIFLLVIPPVEVPAEILPSLSKATQPTV